MPIRDFIYNFLDLSLAEKVMMLSVILIVALLKALVFRTKWIVVILGLLAIEAALAIFLEVSGGYLLLVHIYYIVLSLILSFFIYSFLPQKKGKAKIGKASPWKVVIPVRKGVNIILENIKRGIVIFGSGGAGKTESVFVPLISHAAKFGVCGINYDYKDGELTEILNYFYQGSEVDTYTIIPHRPELSHRVNPVHPDYIDSQEMVNELVSVLFSNLRKKGSNDKGFFMEVPEATLAATIWRLKCDFPQYCTLPHAIAICLVKSPMELARFLSENMHSRIMGAPFFDSIASENQMSGIKASMSNDLRKFAFPSAFYILSGNEVNLHVNDPASPAMINLVNSPGKRAVFSPFLALIFTTTLKLMQRRNMKDSYLLMDEAATLNLTSFSQIPATMRSFNIATIYSLQDKVLGTEQYGDVTARAILANLSYQIIGKTNDPESVKYYKQIVEEIEKKQVSKSYGTGFMPKGESRHTESLKEASKYKNQDFFGLNVGEFLVLSDGKSRKVNFDLMPFERVTLKVKNHITAKDLDDNYNRIFEEAKNI